MLLHVGDEGDVVLPKVTAAGGALQPAFSEESVVSHCKHQLISLCLLSLSQLNSLPAA